MKKPPVSAIPSKTARRSRLLGMVHRSENVIDRVRYRLRTRFSRDRSIVIVPYRGYGTPEKLYLQGRVLHDRPLLENTGKRSRARNLRNMLRRMASREVPYARLQARLLPPAGMPFPRSQEPAWPVEADEEGMFELWLEPPAPLPAGGCWHHVELELLSPPTPHHDAPIRSVGEVFIPPPSARFGIISDIDDTVLQAEATRPWRMLVSMLTGCEHTRLPFPGVATLYRALHAGAGLSEGNPVFYLSSSPVNIYDLLEAFFALRGITEKPLLTLRNWGISEEELLPTSHTRYKLAAIRRIMDLFSDLSFILIGDSGQQDPEIYHQVVHDYPERILAVYIRRVRHRRGRQVTIKALGEEVRAAGSSLLLAGDSLSMGRHMAHHGWIAAQALGEIEDEMHFSSEAWEGSAES